MAKIITLFGEFSNTKDLQKYADAQYVSLESALLKIKKLEEEITHLQTLLASTTELIDSSKVQKIIKTPELAICEAQLEILENRALQKELTLEEIKMVDLLIKNKRLLTGEATVIDGAKKNHRIDYNEAELIKLAKLDNKKSDQ